MNTASRRCRCLLLAAVAGLTAPALVAAEAAAAPGAPAKLGSAVFAWDDLVVKPTATGLRRDVVDRPTATLARFECHVTTLNAGKMSHAPHQHAQEEFIILKEGALDVGINGRTQRVGAGSWFFFAANDWHNVTNVGDGPATYLVFNFATAATRTAPAAPAAESAAPGQLRSTVIDWEKLAVKPTAKGARRELINSPTVTCGNLEGHVTTLNIGETPHAAHRHPDEEIIVVKDGVIEATIDGVARRGGPGSVFFYGSNAEHGMRNVGGTVATYYVFRVVTEATPRPAAK